MELIVFGDSFVEGQIKEPEENTIEQRLEISFVNQMKLMNKQITNSVNYGRRGASNEYIAYQVYEYIKNNNYENKFLLISWSGPARSSYYDITKEQYVIEAGLVNNKYTHYNVNFKNEMLFFGLQETLKCLKIPFAYTSSFTPYNIFPFINKIDFLNKTTNHTLFDIIGLQYNKNQEEKDLFFDHAKYTSSDEYITPCMHPTPLGHKLIAKTLLEELNL